MPKLLSIISARSLSSRQHKENLTQFILKQQEQERANTLILLLLWMVGCLHTFISLLKMGFQEFEYIAKKILPIYSLPRLLVKHLKEALVQSTFRSSKVCNAAFGQKTDLISRISSLLTSQQNNDVKEVCHG